VRQQRVDQLVERRQFGVARGFLKPEDSNLAWSVIDSVYRTQLSDTALDWLTNNAVITTEQRTNAAAILRCISNWVEQAAAA
jgi:hypothetical protein